MDKLFQALERKRGTAPVAAFAESIPMDPSTYYKLKKGTRGLGWDLRRRILQRFPELLAVAFAEVMPGATD